MDITKVCKDLNELNPLVKVMLELALDDIRRQGTNPLVVETYRPQERQNYLYCQGRTTSE
jgi:peptidoglycan L-alanyl-D-glutamate endopeptidase CwlK